MLLKYYSLKYVFSIKITMLRNVLQSVNVVAYEFSSYFYLFRFRMFLDMNGKITIGKSKSSLLLRSFVINPPLLLISRCKSRYGSDLSASYLLTHPRVVNKERLKSNRYSKNSRIGYRFIFFVNKYFWARR